MAKVINTTNGPVRVLEPGEETGAPRYAGPREHTTANTTRIYEEDMQYIDEEPEVAFISPATGYVARFGGGGTREIVLWAVMDDGRFYGVALPKDGRPPLELDSVEDEDGFRSYDKEEK